MTTEAPRPRKTLPSAAGYEGAPAPSRHELAAVEAAVSPLGLTKAIRVPTPGEAMANYTIRVSEDTKARLKHYAYMERLSINEALSKLLDGAG